MSKITFSPGRFLIMLAWLYAFFAIPFYFANEPYWYLSFLPLVIG